MRRGGVFGSAGQSASASFSSSFEFPVRLDEWPAREVARAQTMVLSETRPGGRPDACSGSAKGP